MKNKWMKFFLVAVIIIDILWGIFIASGYFLFAESPDMAVFALVYYTLLATITFVILKNKRPITPIVVGIALLQMLILYIWFVQVELIMQNIPGSNNHVRPSLADNSFPYLMYPFGIAWLVYTLSFSYYLWHTLKRALHRVAIVGFWLVILIVFVWWWMHPIAAVEIFNQCALQNPHVRTFSEMEEEIEKTRAEFSFYDETNQQVELYLVRYWWGSRWRLKDYQWCPASSEGAWWN